MNTATVGTVVNANFTTWVSPLTNANIYTTPFSTAIPLSLHEAIVQENVSFKEDVLVGDIVSNKVRNIFVIVNMTILAQLISIFGVVANIINIIVFIKQGFGEAMTVTLTGLAVADLGTVTCQVWHSICWNPWFDFKTLQLPFNPLQIVYLSSGHPRLSSVRISAMILAWATLERCLCITMPFKVRELITPTRSKLFVMAVFIINTASAMPFYYTSRIVSFFDTAVNRSYLILAFTKDRQTIDSVSFALSASLTVCAFVAVAVLTIVLVYTLDKASKWRESAMASGSTAEQGKPESKESISSKKSAKEGQKEKTKEQLMTKDPSAEEKKKSQQTGASNKNKRAAKMVSIISAIFIVCNIPNTCNQLINAFVPEFAKNGSYVNLNQTFWSVGYLTETVNASVNIFMYYTMSSRYRSIIQEMLCKRCLSLKKDGKDMDKK
ncbi:chemosensory receptor a [Plakobranchus ocellatus]|uniref:Chemosensory receptor a n=1 Tax=Plakobranchus ocellatus TaxID=259542 RepID=A0AAV3YPR3_9GAST|nr:chemosensory receptor a [Plakobranchus ocellatus]